MGDIWCPPITTVYVTMTNDKKQTEKHTLKKEQFNICVEVKQKKRGEKDSFISRILRAVKKNTKMTPISIQKTQENGGKKPY